MWLALAFASAFLLGCYEVNKKISRECRNSGIVSEYVDKQPYLRSVYIFIVLYECAGRYYVLCSPCLF